MEIDSAELYRSLGRIEGKLDALASSFVTHIADDAAQFKELKLGQSIQNKKIWSFTGGVVALWLGIQFFFSHLGKVG